MVCLLATACLDIKPFNAAPPPDGIGEVHAVQDADGGITVTGPGYIVHFPGTGSGLPDDIAVAGVHVLTTSPTTCTDPSGTGVQILPVARTETGAAPAAQLTLSSPGPVVARVVVNAPLTLGSCGTATAISAWSFFPDGRISRFDQIGGTATFAPACSCDGSSTATGFTPRIETLFAASAFTGLEAPDNGIVTPTPEGNTNDGDLICLDNPSFLLLPYDGPGPGPAYYSVGAGHDLGVVYNLTGNPAPDLAGPFNGLSGMFVAQPAASCQAMLTRVAPYQRYVELLVDDSAMDNTNYDGIAGGFTTVPSEFGFTATGKTIKFAPIVPGGQSPADFVAAPPGFAIGMVFGGAPAGFVVTNKAGRTLADEEVKFQQLGTAGRVVMWLRDGIGFDDAVTVTAQ